MSDPVVHSLEIAAEREGDISQAVYDAYFSRCPGSEALMAHIDHIVRGRMLEEVFRLIMLDDYSSEQAYLNFEVDNHKNAYSVEPHMYENLLGALKDTVKEAVGESWDDAFDAAWSARINSLSHEIARQLQDNHKTMT
jgi:hypothetical protein